MISNETFSADIVEILLSLSSCGFALAGKDMLVEESRLVPREKPMSYS